MSAAPHPKRWGEWIGRSEITEDILTRNAVDGLSATLDRESSGPQAQQGVHWLCAPPRMRRGQLGADGHPAKGGFLPPIDLPRRMWASSSVSFLAPITPTCSITRTSTIASIVEKAGGTGRLVFVEIDHAFTADGVPCVHERQTVVYREPASGPFVMAAATEPSEDWPWLEPFPTDPVLLFRYSALTFNGHRIHYDQPYATAVEGYPGLVVHGPLMATLLLDLCDRRLGPNRLSAFSFRGMGPAFSGEILMLAGRPTGDEIELKVFTSDGRVVMTGRAVAATGSET